jgi:hypothetical protein
MTELDYIIDVHRREDRRAQAVFDLTVAALIAIAYGVYRLIGWLA